MVGNDLVRMVTNMVLGHANGSTLRLTVTEQSPFQYNKLTTGPFGIRCVWGQLERSRIFVVSIKKRASAEEHRHSVINRYVSAAREGVITMSPRSMVLGFFFLLVNTVCQAAPGETAADQITLNDGSVVKGLVTSAANGPRGSVEFLVRRAWAEKLPAQSLTSLGSFDRRIDAPGPDAAAKEVGIVAARARPACRCRRQDHRLDRPRTGSHRQRRGSRSRRFS